MDFRLPFPILRVLLLAHMALIVGILYFYSTEDQKTYHPLGLAFLSGPSGPGL